MPSLSRLAACGVLLTALLAPWQARAYDFEEESVLKRQFFRDFPIWADIDFRYRLEHRDNYDFTDRDDDSDWFNLARIHLNITIVPWEGFTIFFQPHEARVGNLSEGKNRTPFDDEIDIRQLYIDMKAIRMDSPIGLRVGRQTWSYGNERLIGYDEWANIGQVFDGFVVRWDAVEDYAFQLDLLGARPTRIRSSRMNAWDRQEDFVAAYATYSLWDPHVVEAYIMGHWVDVAVSYGANVGKGEFDQGLYGARIRGPLPREVNYDIEGAYQFGEFQKQTTTTHDIRAWMVAAKLDKTLDIAWRPNLMFEWAHASGDDDLSDATRGTFDPPFPDGHRHHGYTDRVGLQNLDAYRFHVGLAPAETLRFRSDIHMMYLDTTKDSLYSADGTALRTSRNAEVDKNIGTEFDVALEFDVNRNFQILSGYSHFLAGQFLEDTGDADESRLIYLQAQVNF